MKKILLIAILILFATNAFAAWSIEITDVDEFPWSNGQKMYEINIDCTSDASASGDITLSSQLATDLTWGSRAMNKMRGGIFYAFEYVPDGTDTPTTAPQITVDTASGTKIFDETAAAAGTGEMFDGQVDSDFPVPMTDLIIASTTLANTKKASFKIWILR